jgi:hypothetical protein
MKIAFGYFSLCIALVVPGTVARAQQGSGSGAPVAPVQTNDAAVAKTDAAPANDAAQDASGGSLVRIVRLSEVRETVQLDRNTGRGFEQTIANLPIVQGNLLRTQRGWAEVEFEDDSSLRITPQTMIEFPTLGRTAAGTTINTVKLVRGTMYVSLAKTKGNEFAINVGGETVTLPPSSHIRLDVYPAGSELYVVRGKVTVTDSTGSYEVGKDRALTFGGTAQTAPVVGRENTPGLYDQWDAAAVEYHSFRANGSSPYAYGQRDLSYYGSYADFGGCGEMWRPYFTSAAWDPYANGVWAYYPGSGYTFVSPYPWGWMPYHSGSWEQCGGQWGWRRSGEWHGLKNHGWKPVKGPGTPHPIHAPAGHASFVIAGNGHVPVAHVAGNRFEFTKDSAGLGVPRETFGKLDKFSAEVAAHGSAERAVFVGHLDGGAVGSYGSNMRGTTTVATGGPNSRPVMRSGGDSGGRSGGYGGGGVSHAGGYGGGGGNSGGSSGGSHGGSSSSSASSSSSSASSSSSSSSSSAAASGGSHH